MDTRPWQRHYDYEVPVTLRYPRIPAQDFLHYCGKYCGLRKKPK